MKCYIYSLYVMYTTVIYTLSLHDALPIWRRRSRRPRLRVRLRAVRVRSLRRRACRGEPPRRPARPTTGRQRPRSRSEEHTSELQSHSDLVCRLLLEKKKNITKNTSPPIIR